MASRRKSMAAIRSDLPTRGSRRASFVVNTPKSTNLTEAAFTSGEKFSFDTPEFSRTPPGPLTRSRRSSMMITRPLKQGWASSKIPKTSTNFEKPKKPPRKSMAVAKKAAEANAMKASSSLRKSPVVKVTKKVQIAPEKTPEKSDRQSQTPRRSARKTPAKKLAKIVESSPEVSKVVAPKPILQDTPPKLKMCSVVLKAAVDKKAINVQAPNFLGTPQHMNPANLLRKNLKRQVDTKIGQRILDLPRDLTPYKVLVVETENGSPVEHFVKVDLPENRAHFVTGTPAPVQNKRRVLRQKIQNGGSPHLLTSTPIMKQRLVDDFDDEKVVETQNEAVNKVLAKAGMEQEATTGNFGSYCAIM